MANFFNYINSFFSCFITLFFINEYLRNYYNVEYNLIIGEICYRAVYAYSKIQIIYNKYSIKVINFYNINIDPFIQNNIVPLLIKSGLIDDTYDEEDIPYEVEFILNGDVIYECDAFDLIETRLNNDVPKEYDFIIYSDLSLDNRMNKVLYKTIPKNFDYIVSNVSFILSEIQIFSECKETENETPIKFYFKNNDYNYLIKNNVFDIYFFRYFFKKYYSDKVPDTIDNYSIKLIDNNITITTLSSEENIVIQRDVYFVEKRKIFINRNIQNFEFTDANIPESLIDVFNHKLSDSEPFITRKDNSEIDSDDYIDVDTNRNSETLANV